MNFPSYRRCENSPVLDHPGIALATPKVVVLGRAAVFPLFGSLVVPKKEALEFKGHLMRAVVVLIRGPYPATLNVGHDDLLFADDLVEEGETIRGFFNLNLFEFFDLIQVPNRYFVSVSLFHYLSDVSIVDVVE